MSACVGDPHRAHDGKRTFRTSRAAKRAGRHAMALYGGRAVQAYRCVVCGWWHVGHRHRPSRGSARVAPRAVAHI